ncbi:LysR family transcriptional regulator, partial [Acinetobacter nosocomialis]|uniref:LysR family transcriptional regulator n=1 Tax=Acinetobacter nosocomialis TaxID=106654 RepID=UPI002090678F
MVVAAGEMNSLVAKHLAARKLNRVPSAVSMAVANIEAELGYLLFERTHRKVIPTSAAL